MDSDPNRDVGCTDLSRKSDSVSAPRETAPIPAVTRPGAGPSSAMVTRSRARGCWSKSVEPEVEYTPEGEFPQEVEIPAETDKEGSGTARPTTDTASQYKPEVVTSRDVTTRTILNPHTVTRTANPHTGHQVWGFEVRVTVWGFKMVLVVTSWLVAGGRISKVCRGLMNSISFLS